DFRSVNFKFLPEPIFVSKGFALSLLIIHLGLLAAFAHYKWCKHEGGISKFLHSLFSSFKFRISTTSSFPILQRHTPSKVIQSEHIVTTLFVGNFIGIVCARSLHYQFYSWYFFSLPYLLWKTPFATLLRYTDPPTESSFFCILYRLL
ncbi:Dol-P-Man:Man(5)GlcNAc(2)-PP-Dol alpha-1,3-mannosyltransferase-like protein, partial [Drosera capensis]